MTTPENRATLASHGSWNARPQDRAILASYGAWKPHPGFGHSVWLERQKHYVAQDQSRRQATYAFKDDRFENRLWSGQRCSLAVGDERGGEYRDCKYTTSTERGGMRMDRSRWIQATPRAMECGGT